MASKFIPGLSPRVLCVLEEIKAHPLARADTSGPLTVMTKRKTRMSRCPLL